MRGYVLSPYAQADVEEIWEYSVAQWGIDQAELYIRDLKAALESLVADPRRGRSCDDIRAGYYRYAVGSHIVFYRLSDDVLDVVRILHQRMDFSRHL